MRPKDPSATGIASNVSVAQILEWHSEGYEYPVCGDTNALSAASETTN